HARRRLRRKLSCAQFVTARRSGGLPLFSERLLQRGAVERQVRDCGLQPPVLLAQLPQLAQLGRADAVVLPLPAVERRLGDAELTADLGDGDAALGPAQRRADLLD